MGVWDEAERALAGGTKQTLSVWDQAQAALLTASGAGQTPDDLVRAAVNRRIQNPVSPTTAQILGGVYNAFAAIPGQPVREASELLQPKKTMRQKIVSGLKSISPLHAIQRLAGMAQIKHELPSAVDALRKSGVPLDRETLLRQAVAQASQKVDFTMPLGAPKGWRQKAGALIGNVGGFAAQLLILKKAFPGVNPIGIWEMQSQLHGGIPGFGSANYLAFAAPGKLFAGIKPASVAGKLAKGSAVVGSESAALTGVTAGEQLLTQGKLDKRELLSAAATPALFRVPGLIRTGLNRLLPGKSAVVAPSMAEKTGGIRASMAEKASRMPQEGRSPAGGTTASPTTLEATTGVLRGWLPKVKKARKEIAQINLHKLRQEQAGRGKRIFEKGQAEAEAKVGGLKALYQKVRRGYKGVAQEAEIEPPPFTQEQWNLLDARNAEVNAGWIFDQTSTDQALRRLEAGRILTKSETLHVARLVDPKTGADLIGAMQKARGPDPLRPVGLAVDLAKSFTTLNVQTLWQNFAITGTHPLIALRGVKENTLGMFSKKRVAAAQARVDAHPRLAEFKAMGGTILQSEAPAGRTAPDWAQHQLGPLLAKAGLSGKGHGVKGNAKWAAGGLVRWYGRWMNRANAAFVPAENEVRLSMFDLQAHDIEMRFESRRLPNGEMPKDAQADMWRAKRSAVLAIDTFTNMLAIPGGKTGQDIQSAANMLLFSARSTTSRLARPFSILYTKGDRRYAARLLAGELGTMTGMVAAGAMSMAAYEAMTGKQAPMHFGINPLASDFGKCRVGNTYFDFTFGQAAYYRALARLLLSGYSWGMRTGAGEVVGRVAGQPVQSPWDIGKQFLRSRMNPLIGFTQALATHKDWLGKPISLPDTIWNALGPEQAQSALEAAQDSGLIPALMAAGASHMGVPVMSYKDSAYKARKTAQDQLAKKTYGKAWDNLSVSEQGEIEIANEETFKALDQAVKEENQDQAFSTEKALADQKMFGALVYRRLSKGARKRLAGTNVQLRRQVGGLYLNDERLNTYLKNVSVELNARLADGGYLDELDAESKRYELELIVDESKQAAWDKVATELNLY